MADPLVRIPGLFVGFVVLINMLLSSICTGWNYGSGDHVNCSIPFLKPLYLFTSGILITFVTVLVIWYLVFITLYRKYRPKTQR